MAYYLKLFGTHSQYEAYMGGGEIALPNVSHCISENEVHYNQIHDYSKDYLTFEVVSGGYIYIIASNANISKTISYSTDDGSTWTELTTNTTEQSLGGYLPTGDKVLVKGINSNYSTSSYYNRFRGSAKVNVCGNIMSLINGDDFAKSNTLNSTYTFKNLFYEYTNLLSSENLILPATALTNYCYANMFNSCKSLTTAPKKLPAITLAPGCYQYMFQSCSSLTTPPELPATTLADYCYNTMFARCTSLTTAPELPATTLTTWCYTQLFQNCKNLSSITCLATDISASYCTNSWVQGVASTGTFVKNASATWTTTGINGIPTGWTVQTASA